ncbi:MAG: AMP-binding protein, partial [Gemmatimonadota bacterium]|nr:AMP-binding protein [Gemmatimonadota bacterium]
MSEPQNLNALLRHWAEATPDKWFLRFPEADLTYGGFQEAVEARAAALYRFLRPAQGGTGPGESPPVLPALLPNCREAVELWFAATRLGWIWAPINTQFRGPGLAHAINLTGASTLIVDGDLIPHVLAIADSLRHLETLIVAGPSDSADPELQEGLSMVDLDSLRVFGDSPRAPDADPLRTCLLIYTSGTTGPSKACELSMAYLIGQGRLMTRCLGIGQSDVLFCPYPLFHWDASVGTVIPALLNGATAVIAQRFSVSRFWGYVRRYGATVFDFMGATLGFLYKQDPDPDDANNPARLAWGVPMPAFKSDFEKRFDLTLVEGYGSTEGGVMAFQTPGQSYPDGSCGRALPEFRLQIVDDGDRPLPAGSVGEIVARPAREGDGHLMMTGYFGMPTANAEAFRGGWFHTGDLGRLDPAGNLFFEGRKKDAIRRRGENISAFEVEQVIESHPFVLEAAAYGVPSEHTEEDVAAAVVLRPGTALSAEQLLSYCGDRMASHMVPSFIRFLDKLPK